MTTKTAVSLASSLWLLTVSLAVAAVVLIKGNVAITHRGVDVFTSGLIFVPGLSTVGGLLASRRQTNPIGWLFLAVGLAAAAGVFSFEYALRAYVTLPGSLPAGWLMAWFQGWMWAPVWPALAFALLLFPDGRLPSPRWRAIAWGMGLSFGCVILFAMFQPEFWLTPGFQLTNPVGIDGLPDYVFFSPILLGAVGILASVIAPFVRLRRAKYREREQLKWFAYVFGAACLIAVFAVLLSLRFPQSAERLGVAVVAGIGLGIPGAIGVAILKHNLYEIDRIINRTLVYGPLTVILALSYFTVVAWVSSFAGDSELTVAAATLAVAALFQPLRRHVQAFIDRRFYRRKYDAAKTLEVFSTRLRDEIDIESLTGELLAVVQLTMQPAHASLWLRAPEARR